MKKQIKTTLFSWNLIILGCIAIFLIGFTLVNSISILSLLQNSEKTEGVVRDFVQICTGDSCNMCPEISYAIKDGTNYTFVSGSCGIFTRHYLEGQSLQVIYNSKNSSRASINSFIFVWGYTLFIFFLAICFSAAFVTLLKKNLNKK